jgi:hypothetical protein
MKEETGKVRLIMEENNPKWEKGDLYPYFKFYIFYPVRYFIYSPVGRLSYKAVSLYYKCVAFAYFFPLSNRVNFSFVVYHPPHILQFPLFGRQVSKLHKLQYKLFHTNGKYLYLLGKNKFIRRMPLYFSSRNREAYAEA